MPPIFQQFGEMVAVTVGSLHNVSIELRVLFLKEHRLYLQQKKIILELSVGFNLEPVLVQNNIK